MADGSNGHLALGWRSATGLAPGDTAEDPEQDGDSEERDVEGLSPREREECRNDEQDRSEKESQRSDLAFQWFHRVPLGIATDVTSAA